MQFLVLIYNDPKLVDAMPASEFDKTMRGCIGKADEMQREGTLLASRMLQPPSTARSIRIREGKQTILDGPFAETKEVLAGFNLIEAENIDEAVQLAMNFPWSATGCVEVRPVLDSAIMRERVGA
ncbi:MAG TPA: YciI family protein [Gemmatimonadaceae bacterium]